MTTIVRALLLLVLLAGVAPAAPEKPAAKAKPGGVVPIEEDTGVRGTIPIDIGGTWLFVTHMRMAKDPSIQKYRTLPQLVRVAPGRNGTPSLHLLDARLPGKMDETVKELNKKMDPWTPSEADLKLLAKELPRLKPTPDAEKDIVAGDVAFASIRYDLATPESYAELFPQQDEALVDVLSETAFVLQVLENYRGLPLPPGSNVAPLMQRRTIYGVRNASDALLEGRHVIGFIAAGIGQPIPITSVGSFRMYRIAAGPKVGGGGAGKASRPKAARKPDGGDAKKAPAEVDASKKPR